MSEVDPQVFATLPGPVALEWTGTNFIATSRMSSGDKLFTISADGKDVQPFAPSFTAKDESYVAVSKGVGGFPMGNIYVSASEAIYEIDPSGMNARVFSSPPDSTQIRFLAFDTVGTWNYDLLAVSADGMVWIIDSSGRASRGANLGGGLALEGITVAPIFFGSFGGDMIVGLENDSRVVAISARDFGQVSTLATFPNEQPERVLTIPENADLFTGKSDANVIIKVPASAFSGFAGSLLVTTEGEHGHPGSLVVLKAVGSTVTKVTILKDTTSPHFEGAVFVQAGAAALAGSGASYQYGWLGIGIVVGVVVGAFILARNRIR